VIVELNLPSYRLEHAKKAKEEAPAETGQAGQTSPPVCLATTTSPV